MFHLWYLENILLNTNISYVFQLLYIDDNTSQYPSFFSPHFFPINSTILYILFSLFINIPHTTLNVILYIYQSNNYPMCLHSYIITKVETYSNQQCHILYPALEKCIYRSLDKYIDTFLVFLGYIKITSDCFQIYISIILRILLPCITFCLLQIYYFSLWLSWFV